MNIRSDGTAGIDLHAHTHLSDSPLSADELLAQARRHGLRWLAITDHETATGFPGYAAAAARYGVGLIPGIEVSTVSSAGILVHLLGYGIRPDAADSLEAALAPVREGRTAAVRSTVARLQERGLAITWDDVLAHVKGPSVFKAHLMHTLVDLGYTNRLKGRLHDELSGPGQPLADHGYSLPAEQAIRLIHGAGGAAVMAHPLRYGGFAAVDEVAGLDLDGIEAYHPSHDAAATETALAAAGRHGLLVTGGSDYHAWYGGEDVVLGWPELRPRHLAALRERIEARGGVAALVTPE